MFQGLWSKSIIAAIPFITGLVPSAYAAEKEIVLFDTAIHRQNNLAKAEQERSDEPAIELPLQSSLDQEQVDDEEDEENAIEAGTSQPETVEGDSDELADDAAAQEGLEAADDDETPEKKELEKELAATTTLQNPYSEPVQIVVSLNNQNLNVYRGQEIIASSRISSGRSGHATPTGIFSILNKRKRHFSNIYNNAPMPYMQRLTWTGIALHGSNSVPRYAASHGCVRLPYGFDKKLFSMTDFGGHVIVTGGMEKPQSIQNDNLPGFVPTLKTSMKKNGNNGIQVANNGNIDSETASEVAKANANIDKTQIANLEPAVIERTDPHSQEKPIRIVITRNTEWNSVRQAQEMLYKIGLYDGELDGQKGPETLSAIRAYQHVMQVEPNGKIDEAFKNALSQEAGFPTPKNGWISVRKDYKPFYSATLNIKDPSKPLGTHLLVAQKAEKAADGNVSFIWNAYSIENNLKDAEKQELEIKGDDLPEEVDLKSTLDRIEMSPDVRQKIERMMTVGASLVITDAGLSRYTGKGTDFVVNTHINRSYKALAAPVERVRSTRRVRSASASRARQRSTTATYRAKRSRASYKKRSSRQSVASKQVTQVRPRKTAVHRKARRRAVARSNRTANRVVRRTTVTRATVARPTVTRPPRRLSLKQRFRQMRNQLSQR